MNVSSVKNLNGEVFSAVQDASLTNVVQTNSGNWQDITAYQNASATYLTAVDLSPYQTIAGMTAYQPVGSYATTNELEQVSADITAIIPSTAGLASESYVQTNSAVLTGMIDGKQDTLTFGYDEQDRINSINSSALAGGDVPEDVMVESAIGYNAVNEISGYNGSAIAQYGAEKQWLVHDDTLVHAANSAQYALGVNLSAVAQLLGVDETVLFDNSGNVGKANISAYTLSESVNNFDRLRISFARGQNFYGDQCFEYNVNTYPKMVSLNCYDPSSPNAYRYFCSFTISGSEFTELAGKCGYSQIIGGSLTTTSNNWLHPYKIVGIGRKQ